MDITKLDLPLTVNTDDLTLDELDRANKLTQNGTCGNMAALAFVQLKREHPGIRVEDVKRLRARDVVITDDDEQAAIRAQEDAEADAAADPTP